MDEANYIFHIQISGKQLEPKFYNQISKRIPAYFISIIFSILATWRVTKQLSDLPALSIAIIFILYLLSLTVIVKIIYRICGKIFGMTLSWILSNCTYMFYNNKIIIKIQSKNKSIELQYQQIKKIIYLEEFVEIYVILKRNQKKRKGRIILPKAENIRWDEFQSFLENHLKNN